MRSTVSGLRLLATDLAAAGLQLGVGGLASGVSWLARRRQDAAAVRAERVLAAELADALVEAEAGRDGWEVGEMLSRDTLNALQDFRWCFAHGSLHRYCRERDTVCDLRAEPAEHGFDGVCPSDGPVCGHGPVSAAVTTPAADNTQLADHIQQLWDYHQPAVGSGMKWFCEGCDWNGDTKRAHTRHRIGLVADMKAAEVRVATQLKEG